jgi:ATP phosphoribosyltransferase regulatory subunit
MDLGHTGIVDTLMDQLALGKDFNQDFLSIIQRKSEPDMATLLSNVDASCELKNACMSIITLHGKADVLTRAREQLNLQETAIPQQLDYLEELSSVLKTRLKATDLHFDLAESRGYHYQQGVVFSAFCAQQGQELARGGRYDNIGENFGRARPATGFSADLKKLIEVSDANTDNPSEVIFAPAQDDSALLQKIQELRTDGHIVVTGLSAHAEAIESENCSKILVCENGQWMIKDKS